MAVQGRTTSSRVDIIKRAINRKQPWDDKEEFLDVLYWMRQVVSVFVGVTWGIIPMTGAIGMLSYLVLGSGLVYIYCSLYQKVDEEEFGGLWELLKEGFMTSFAIFLVLWIVTYTAIYHN